MLTFPFRSWSSVPQLANPDDQMWHGSVHKYHRYGDNRDLHCRASQLSNVIVRVFLSWIIFHTFMANLLSTNGLKQMGPSTWIVWHNRSPSTRVPLGLQSIAPGLLLSTHIHSNDSQQHSATSMQKKQIRTCAWKFSSLFWRFVKKKYDPQLEGPLKKTSQRWNPLPNKKKRVRIQFQAVFQAVFQVGKIVPTYLRFSWKIPRSFKNWEI